ncbi:hypothetical protein AVEN_40409-1 [Araneus ventricosus]|uniref:Uncharacterized protein n=1 Tax=Araneus ventricosus TaxID=182803 RepID=A0A4Y2DB65_ARAVE|nr:hypothetical protein AVEN_40409-1 [Araneus ventricosus]
MDELHSLAEFNSLKPIASPLDSLPGVFFHTELLTHTNKSSQHSEYLRQAALEVINNIPIEATLFYTDGSKNEIGYTAHSWYRSEAAGATIHFKGDRKNQTALAHLTSGHLKTLRFSRGDKKFNICTKCNMIEATPQHLLDCVALVYDDLLKRLDFVLEMMKENDLMDLI